ncbi:dermonecrotic toxin domain-containing protein [Pseudomonas sp. NFX224]|uniref:dermonecrotic toxin domain-containing protein n=1 Tax=Pseudomonas sp. NFX224 TaxID=3402862 RepID=UPI003AFB285C
MLDEPMPPPADFGLVPLVASVDQSLLLSALARWKECRKQWLDLMAQSPRPPLDSMWWNARARGTDISRKAQATRLYRQHFEASSQVAFALGSLQAEQMKTLEAAPDAAVISVEQLTLSSADGRRAELPGALVISQGDPHPVAQMLYLPAHQTSWRSFSSRNDLQCWLIDHQQQLLGPSQIDAGTVTVAYTALASNPLELGAESLLSELSSAEADLRGSALAQAPDLPVSGEPSSDNAALFGLLSPDIPLGLRRKALTQQQSALEDLLGKDFQGNTDDPRRQQLQRQLDALNTAEQASVRAATALLTSANPLRMLELRSLPNADYAALYHARLAGLRAEADAQLTLNQISREEHQWLKTALDAPDGLDGHSDVVVARITLQLIESDGASSTTQAQELDGVLVFTHPSALQSDPSQSLLLYWPGRYGGLQRFDSRQALERTLFKLTTRNQSLLLSPLSVNPFEYALQNQLYRSEQQAVRLIAENPVASHANQRAVKMDNLREQTLARLTVAIPAARELAFAQWLEQTNSSGLANNLPPWLGALTDAQRAQLKGLFTSCITAMKRAHELLERELPPREAFSKKAIDARLRQDFGLMQNVEVTLDLPDDTYWQRILIEGAAPGTPQQNVLFASPQRSRLSLAELAQGNIDQALWLRLSFMKVEITADDESERETLKSGITQAWLRKMITELDLAGEYEKLIRDTFLGTSSASTFSNEHRRECLSEPWRLMLKLQGEVAMLQRQISAAGLQVLQIAIDANRREDYAADGKRIVLLPAHLTVGGEDTQNRGPSTLAGVTFIVEQISGLTLLYLPDSPDDQFLREYASLEEARKALFNLCLHTRMVSYLADRALTGETARHVSRTNQALLKNYDALIGIGTPWPATTSLAAHLLNVHMGRLLEAHRATSRSNDALFLERVALKSGAMFNYLKMAVGMLPFVGAAVALYDAWSSANLAVAAFLRGQVGHGLAEVEAVLLSLIDAAMDVLPGAAATSTVTRAATRTRQLRSVTKSAGALHKATQRQARHTLERFRGYEYEHPISLAGLQPGSHGAYRTVYRHADGDFMISHGRIYRIELSNNPQQWRLHGTWARPYKQPIALDEAGNWNTHYAVYGTVIEGGGAGGGAVLGHMADGLDPLWPAAIRRWLPRWWTDRALRRQLTLTNTAEAYTRQLDTQTRASNTLLTDYFDTRPVAQRPTRAQVDLACANDIELAQNQYRNLEELMLYSHGRKRTAIEDIQSRCAWIIVDRSIRRVDLARERLLEYVDRIDQLIVRSDMAPAYDPTPHIQLKAQRKKIRKDFIKEFDHLHDRVEDAHRWNRRITNRTQKSTLKPQIETLSTKLSDANYYYLKSAHVLEIITDYDAVTDLSWFYFHKQLHQARNKVGRALLTQQELPAVRASFSQRNKVLEDCLATYTEFRRQLTAWTLGYPQHLDLPEVEVFLDNLNKVEEFAHHAIKNRPSTTPIEGHSGKQLFETEDNQLLIGVASTDPVTKQKRFTLEGITGHSETWQPRASGKYHLSEPEISAQPQLPMDVGPLLIEAKKRLGAIEAYRVQVEGYARRNMLPVDLEHMMSSEAAELNMRAKAIEGLSPTETVAVQLRNRADELLRTGRTLRIDQSMNSKTPTEGYLDDLLEQRVVDIRKEGVLRDLGKRPDGRRDFLQEYEVRDLRGETAQTLWYAHFHYTSAKPAFNEFVKGHLKLPEQRNLGLQWQQAAAASGAPVEAIWRGDIGKPFGVKHFSDL